MNELGSKIGSFKYIKLLLVIVFGVFIGEVGSMTILPNLDLRQEVVIISKVEVDKTIVRAGDEVKLTVTRTKLLECPMQVVSYWENERGTIYHADVRAGYNIKPSTKNFGMILKVPHNISIGIWNWFRTLQHECKIDTKPTRFKPLTFTVVK